MAAKQAGNITRRQLLGLGVDDDAIRYRVKIGRLYRVFRGVYSVGRRPITVQEWASAAVLACGPGAALSHASAMVLWGY
ncbi:MAG: type IV toxin-antitoxin system AbiEi family antitoxin domain-containing protein, partial [Solirubrobacterales bacterium]|nr:type IV toxin-antitoxin system AbiEi family antitoxin domain-containing protein [Solirubrobacterales bacterium]